MSEPLKCGVCGDFLDWRAHCLTCRQLARLRGKIAANGGFKKKRNAERGTRKLWRGPSGVDNALPPGDRD